MILTIFNNNDFSALNLCLSGDTSLSIKSSKSQTDFTPLESTNPSPNIGCSPCLSLMVDHSKSKERSNLIGFGLTPIQSLVPVLAPCEGCEACEGLPSHVTASVVCCPDSFAARDVPSLVVDLLDSDSFLVC